MKVKVAQAIHLEVNLIELARCDGRDAVGDDLEYMIPWDDPPVFESSSTASPTKSNFAPSGLGHVNFHPVHEELALTGDLTPNEDNFVLPDETVGCSVTVE